jgi:hypothetical protein
VDIHNIDLRASRILRRGDCQRPPYWAGRWANTLGLRLAPEPDKEETEKHIYQEDNHERLGLDQNGKAASAEAPG